MKFSLLCDADWDSRVDTVLHNFDDSGYRRFFEERNYGTSIDGVFIIFMCRNPEYNFKQRIRYSKKDKKLYIDIMLNLYEFRQMEQKEREKVVAQRLVSEIPPIIAKYKFDDFDLQKFSTDLKKRFGKF